MIGFCAWLKVAGPYRNCPPPQVFLIPSCSRKISPQVIFYLSSSLLKPGAAFKRLKTGKFRKIIGSCQQFTCVMYFLSTKVNETIFQKIWQFLKLLQSLIETTKTKLYFSSNWSTLPDWDASCKMRTFHF